MKSWLSIMLLPCAVALAAPAWSQTTESLARPNEPSYGWAYLPKYVHDWDRRDYAVTSGALPKGLGKDGKASVELCSAAHVGMVAECWNDREFTKPMDALKVDEMSGRPDINTRRWCTYKVASVNLSTPPDGRAPPPKVFVCTQFTK